MTFIGKTKKNQKTLHKKNYKNKIWKFFSSEVFYLFLSRYSA